MSYDEFFKPRQYKEYEYRGKKYIRCDKPCFPDELSKLSNGEAPRADTTYWVEVRPIEWLVDPTGTWISKKALLAGIPFDTQYHYLGDFSKTFMKRYLDTYFVNEMGHDEMIAQQKRDKILSGFSEKLEALCDVEAIKKDIKPASTAERTEELIRIKQVRRGRDIIIDMANKVHETGDRALLRELADMELVRIYGAREQGMRNRVERRRLARRFKRKQSDR